MQRKDDKQTGLQRLRFLFESALNENAANQPKAKEAAKKHEKNLSWSKWATVIPPLSLFITIPALRKIGGLGTKTRIGIAALAAVTPVVSGLFSWAGSEILNMLEEPESLPVVKRVVPGKPEEVEAREKELRRRFKAKSIAVPAKGEPVQPVDKAYTRLVDSYEDESHSERRDEYLFEQKEEKAPEKQLKPRRVYLPNPQASSQEPSTVVLMTSEQAKLQDLAEGKTDHALRVYRQWERLFTVKVGTATEGSANQVKDAIQLLFLHAKRKNQKIVNDLDRRYPDPEAAASAPALKSYNR